MTPTGRTLVHLRRLGFVCDIVERWLPRINRKRDCFGIADIIAVHPRDKTVLLLQVTTAAHVPDRLRRIQGRPELPLLLRAGVLVEVWGWGKGRKLRRVKAEPGAECPRPEKVKGDKQRELFG